MNHSDQHERKRTRSSGRIALEDYPELLSQMKMIHLTSKDLELIATFRPVIISQIERITDSFFESILHVDALKQILTQYTTVDRLRQALSEHLIEMFAGCIDSAFIEKRLKIALVHQKIGLPVKWYMGSFQNLLNTFLQILDETADSKAQREGLHEAITKLICFEQQLVLEAYEQQNRLEEQQAKAMIEYQALHDELTGLSNRRMFHQALTQAIEHYRESGVPFAVFVMDVDRFKMINDSLGHTSGDRFLQEFSNRIRTSTKDYPVTIARLGGDEFTLILEKCTDPTLAEELAENMVKAIEMPYCLQNQDYYVSASIGIALYPNHGENEEQLLKNADIAMYEVKKNGDKRHQFFSKIEG